jgi:uncharacterized membrane protein
MRAATLFRAGLPAALLLAWGCGGSPDGPGNEPAASGAREEATPFRGPRVPGGTATVRLFPGSEGELRLLPCPDSGPAPVAGSHDTEPRLVRDASGQEVAAILREFGASPAGVPARVVLDGDLILQLRVALSESPEGRGCLQAFPDADLEASGNEPFWHLRVEGDQVLFRTPDDPDGTVFHALAWTELDAPQAGWRGEALRDFVDGIEYLVLEVLEAPCVDSMSGARFPWTAFLEQAGDRWSGCAREGRGLPVASGPVR